MRYVKWVTNLARGDWGFSFNTKAPVINLVLSVSHRLCLVGIAYLIAISLAIPIGVISAVRQYSVFDQVATFFSFIGFSVPSFFTGLALMLVFA